MTTIVASAFDGIGMEIDGLRFLSPREAGPLLLSGNAVLVDLREGLETGGREFDVPEVIHLPSRRFLDEAGALPKDRPLILADCVGIKSKECLRILRARGFRSVASLIGGMVDWEDDGLPTAVDHDEELVGGCACKLKPRKAYRTRKGETE